MSYRITTDSTTDMNKEFYEKYDIQYIGLSYTIEDKEYKEGAADTLTSAEFYAKLKKGELATTSQVNTYSFVEFVEPFLKNGEDIFHIAFSSSLSGTAESCRLGIEEMRKKYPERKICFFDSLAASTGEGLMVEYAAINREKGMTIEENYEWIKTHQLNFLHIFTVDDLMHLHRGGRVSKASAVVGSLIGIKPVMHMAKDGTLQVTHKVRGRANSLNYLVDRMKEYAYDNIKEQPVYVCHGDAYDDATYIKGVLEKEHGFKNVRIGEIGTVIGSHTGPGIFALFFMGNSAERD